MLRESIRLLSLILQHRTTRHLLSGGLAAVLVGVTVHHAVKVGSAAFKVLTLYLQHRARNKELSRTEHAREAEVNRLLEHYGYDYPRRISEL